ncbi:MAG: N-acetylneuraminate synthase family protein, partial [Deltaproteobacteria bacterium]|nr:N-acetylneuraminate synthase family protein [Deltaproteobacteria bacterium]
MEIRGRKIGPGQPCYIIAEAGSNHDGSLAKALELIDAAAEAGADAVKFQLFQAKNLYPRQNMVVETAGGRIDLYRFFEDHELSLGWLDRLKARCQERSIHFLCTPFHPEAVEPLAEAGVDGLKIASPELNHFPLLAAAARTGKGLFVSTGISRLGDIEAALEELEKHQAQQIAILHCVTAYPAPAEDYNLAVMDTIRRAFGRPTGLSDHSLGTETPILAAY